MAGAKAQGPLAMKRRSFRRELFMAAGGPRRRISRFGPSRGLLEKIDGGAGSGFAIALRLGRPRPRVLSDARPCRRFAIYVWLSWAAQRALRQP
jgi:hypothetical protein